MFNYVLCNICKKQMHLIFRTPFFKIKKRKHFKYTVFPINFPECTTDFLAHCTILCFHFSDAQIPDVIKPHPSHWNAAGVFWEFYYKGLAGAAAGGSSPPGERRTTRQTNPTTQPPWNIPSVADREYSGKIQKSMVAILF